MAKSDIIIIKYLDGVMQQWVNSLLNVDKIICSKTMNYLQISAK